MKSNPKNLANQYNYILQKKEISDEYKLSGPEGSP